MHDNDMAAILSRCSLSQVRWKCSLGGFRRIILERYFGQQIIGIPLATAIRNLVILGTYRRKLPLYSVYRACFHWHTHLQDCSNGGLCQQMVVRHFCSQNKTDKQNSEPDIKSKKIDIRNDPEVRSILDEISQHFQEDHGPISSETTTPRRRMRDDSYRQNNKESDNTSPHLKDKFSLYEDAEASVILDVHEELALLQRESSPLVDPACRSIPRMVKKFGLKRGVQGVFDIEEFVQILSAENAQDVCVIKVKPELLYADYLVVASGRSTRHLRAIAEFVVKLYKAKKHQKDEFVIIQGEESKTWLAMDMGNIIMHLFLPEERAKYDIEMLWSVGPEYDDLCQRPTGAFDDRLHTHLQYLDELRPLHN